MVAQLEHIVVGRVFGELCFDIEPGQVLLPKAKRFGWNRECGGTGHAGTIATLANPRPGKESKN